MQSPNGFWEEPRIGECDDLDLIEKLSCYPSNARVTLLDPNKRWLLPIQITHLLARGAGRNIDFVAITADTVNDEIEGLAD